jgi:multicomponent Na+:H+ antiporter subunit F
MNDYSGKITWFIGLLSIAGILLLIIFYPAQSLLRWQSGFLAQCFLVLMLCFALCLFRVVAGPSTADRAAALNSLSALVVGFCAILSIPTGRDWYIDVAIAWALQSFIGMLAVAKYLEGKGFDE